MFGSQSLCGPHRCSVVHPPCPAAAAVAGGTPQHTPMSANTAPSATALIIVCPSRMPGGAGILRSGTAPERSRESLGPPRATAGQAGNTGPQRRGLYSWQPQGCGGERMKYPGRIGSAAVLAATALAAATVLAGPASAAAGHGPRFGGARHVVFVQTDNTAGNQVVAYHRAGDGTLSFAGTYNTGRLGDQLDGSVSDHLASQGALTYDPRHSLLFAVNAGSDTVTVFVAHGSRLFRQQIISSGGRFPVSVAVHGNLVYVLNALNGGSVRGYRVFAGRLFPIRGS